jgi:CubicO group peptidase (beta-lactamase class C family)
MGVTGDSTIPLGQFLEELLTVGGPRYSEEYFSLKAPGSTYEYSNIGYALIGYLVERVSGQDFSDYCREHIFVPLEMHDTGWHLRDFAGKEERIIFNYGFTRGDDRFNTGATSVEDYRRVEHFSEHGYPAGCLRTTLPDFSHFVSALMNEGKYKDSQLLKPETVELMLAPQGIAGIPGRTFPVKDIALTWLIVDIDGSEYYSMNGFSGSGFTNALFSRDKKSGCLFYCTGISAKTMGCVGDVSRKLLAMRGPVSEAPVP